LGRRACAPAAPEYRADTRQQLAKAERLGDIVVRAELQPDHPVDLVVLATRRDDDGNVGARPYFTEQVEPVVLAKAKIKNDEAKLARGKMTGHFRPARDRRGAHLVLLEIVDDHGLHGDVIVHDKYVHRHAAFVQRTGIGGGKR
jgi:hypothetical protein